MNRLRSIWRLRGVVALLLASLVPVSFATALHAAQHTSSYADWLRAQIRGPLDGAVAEALEEVADTPASSLDAFLDSFVKAYEARQPETPLAQALLALDLSNESLVAYLQGRFNGFVSVAVLPRVAFAATPAASGTDRLSVPQAVWGRQDPVYVRRALSLVETARPLSVQSVRLGSAAQPRGP